MEKVINEFRIIETEDGFRIEIKGDKEKIKKFMMGFGGGHRWGHWRRHRPHGWGSFGFGPLMWMRAASCWGPWGSEEGEEKETEEV
jgi:hypothetical protein